MSTASGGQIVTFYSYKGGTGRTMALANVAWILASNGMRVLAVDWDLESPGLHKFFHPFLDESTIAATPGVIEIVSEYAWAVLNPEPRPPGWYQEYARVLPHAVSLEWPYFPGVGTLDFISAGLAESGLLIHSRRLQLGQFLRSPRRRYVPRCDAPRHEGELRLYTDR